MSDWMLFPSGQYNFIKEGDPKRVVWVRRSHLGWDWIIQDITGRQLDRGSADTASAAKDNAMSKIAGLSDNEWT